MRLLITILTLVSFATIDAMAQKSDTDVLRSVADGILARHNVGYVDRNTKQIYTKKEDVPSTAKVYFQSHTMDWHYATGVMNLALVRLSEALNEPKYREFSKNQIDYCLDSYKFWEARKDEKGHSLYHYLWQFRELDHCGAESAAMLELLRYYPDAPQYREIIDKTTNHIATVQERTSDGTLVRSWPHQNTLWADDLYMGLIFLARQGSHTGEKRFFDDAVLQVRNFNKYLWNPTKELYYHAYFNDLKTVAGAHWGRCNGWVMLATTELASAMPDSRKDKTEMIALLKRQIAGVARYQDPSGMWHQLLDKPDSYLESSCSAIFVFCVARAINRGWLDKRYAPIALDGWAALRRNKITDKGDFKDVCVGTGIGNNLLYYYNRKKMDNEVHGLGLVIDAGLEIIELKKNLQ